MLFDIKIEEISKFPELIRSLFKNPDNFDPSIELLSLYGFTRYSEIPKLMKDDETFECVKGQEFNIELSSYLTIINLNNSLNGIERFKANINIKNH